MTHEKNRYILHRSAFIQFWITNLNFYILPVGYFDVPKEKLKLLSMEFDVRNYLRGGHNRLLVSGFQNGIAIIFKKLAIRYHLYTIPIIVICIRCLLVAIYLRSCMNE